MPQEKDHCRACGKDVVLGEDGAVCPNCPKTLCTGCGEVTNCPHPDYAPNKGAVSAEEHEKLKADLNDEDALVARLAEIRAARGEGSVKL